MRSAAQRRADRELPLEWIRRDRRFPRRRRARDLAVDADRSRRQPTRQALSRRHGDGWTSSQPDEQTEFYDKVFDQLVNLWQTDQAMGELILDPRIGRMAAELAGVDGVRVWHDQALIKRPYANPTAFHLDVPYWSFTSPRRDLDLGRPR